MNIAARQCGVRRLRAHLNDFHIEPVLLENLPLLRRKQSQTADGNIGIGNTEFAPRFLGKPWRGESNHQECHSEGLGQPDYCK